jgi:hypothetical protein
LEAAKSAILARAIDVHIHWPSRLKAVGSGPIFYIGSLDGPIFAFPRISFMMLDGVEHPKCSAKLVRIFLRVVSGIQLVGWSTVASKFELTSSLLIWKSIYIIQEVVKSY